MLVRRLVEQDGGLLVNTQHRLLTISLDVHQVPEVIVEWICSHLLQCLDAIADVKPELDNVAN